MTKSYSARAAASRSSICWRTQEFRWQWRQGPRWQDVNVWQIWPLHNSLAKERLAREDRRKTWAFSHPEAKMDCGTTKIPINQQNFGAVQPECNCCKSCNRSLSFRWACAGKHDELWGSAWTGK